MRVSINLLYSFNSSLTGRCAALYQSIKAEGPTEEDTNNYGLCCDLNLKLLHNNVCSIIVFDDLCV